MNSKHKSDTMSDLKFDRKGGKMSYQSIDGKKYENEHDEMMSHRYGDKYTYIKNKYPEIYKLPEEEIDVLAGIITRAGDMADAEEKINEYIEQKEPEWQQLYGLDYEDKEENQNQDSNSFWQSPQNNDFWGGYGNKQNTSSLTTPQGSNNTQTLGNYFMDNVEDIGYGAKKAISGATFGASDWALRRLGLDNEQEYLAKKQAEGLGELTKGLGVASEIGGNILGAGGALVKGLQNTGLNGLKLATAAGGIEGAAYGLTSSDRLTDAPKNMAWGAGLGAALPVAFHGAGQSVRAIAKPFSSRLMTAGMKGGLNNVASNPNAVKILKQGLRNNDDIAQSYLEHVLPATRDINRGTAEMVDNALTRRINVPETIAAERARYGDYMAAHGADEVMDFAPQVTRYRGGSDTAVLKSIRRNMEKQDPEFKFRLDEEGRNDYPHFLKDTQRAQYVETLPSTHNKPQQIIRSVYDGQNREYRLKQYYNPENKKSVYDMVINNPDDGRLVTKFAREGKTGRKEFEKVLKNRPESQVAETGRGLSQAGQTPIPNAARGNNIPQQSIVVNPELPHISSLYEGLTAFQSGQLDKAIKTGLSKTNQKAGSLESLNKIKQEINEAIAKAKSTDKPSEVWQLQELKSKFDDAMPQGLKEVDAGFSRAKSLEDAFDKGTHYNPDNVSGADMIKGLSVDEQNAFAQGLFKRINNNSLSGKDLAKDALKYENTLSQVLPQDAYNQLIQGLNLQSTRFGRLSELGRIAENRLRAPEGTRLFGREQLESKGSLIGSGIDWANNLLRGGAIRRSALNLLNPSFNGVPARESFVVRNPALSAGLTPTALNNLGFYQNQ